MVTRALIRRKYRAKKQFLLMVANLSFLEMFVIIIPVPSQRFSVQFAHKTHFVSGAIYTTTPEARVNSKNCIFEVKILVMSRVAGSVGADYL